MKVKNIIFDLGGVIMTIDQNEAINRFSRLGLENAKQKLDPYTQSGIFGDIEEGKISASEFIRLLSQETGRTLNYEQCKYAWKGYAKDVPARNIQAVDALRTRGYNVILLSNTNPFMMDWATKDDFTGDGRKIQDLFPTRYLSYELGMMKPDERIFRHIIAQERILPYETLFVDDGPRNTMVASQLGMQTFCPQNGEDWTQSLMRILEEE